MSTPQEISPMSHLHRLYEPRQIQPRYELLHSEGPSHNPSFTYQVTAGPIVATGSGSSHRKAKHRAAKSAIDQIEKAQKRGGPILFDQLEMTAKVSYPFDDDLIIGNPVGDLQELCHLWQLEPPEYEEGHKHGKLFVCLCHADREVEIGEGKSKRSAKKKAAFQMLNTLKTKQPVEESEEADLAASLDRVLSKFRSEESKNDGAKTVAVPQKKGHLLKELREMSLQMLMLDEPIKRLEGIALEQRFRVTYVHLEETADSERFNCMVKLSVSPVVVCFGSTKSRQKSKEAAAFNALKFLKMITGVREVGDARELEFSF